MGLSVVSGVILMHQAVALLHVLAGGVTRQCGSRSPRASSFYHGFVVCEQVGS